MGKIIFYLKIIIGSVLGTGYIPFAPATFASLITVPLILALNSHPVTYLILVVGFFWLGVYLANELEKIWGKDGRRITIDELVGMLIVFLGIRLPNIWAQRLAVLLAGFFLFRFFDIFKLPLIRKSQTLSGGFGVMIDDLLAAIVANLCLRLLMIIFL